MVVDVYWLGIHRTTEPHCKINSSAQQTEQFYERPMKTEIEVMVTACCCWCGCWCCLWYVVMGPPALDYIRSYVMRRYDTYVWWWRLFGRKLCSAVVTGAFEILISTCSVYALILSIELCTGCICISYAVHIYSLWLISYHHIGHELRVVNRICTLHYTIFLIMNGPIQWQRTSLLHCC